MEGSLRKERRVNDIPKSLNSCLQRVLKVKGTRYPLSGQEAENRSRWTGQGLGMGLDLTQRSGEEVEGDDLTSVESIQKMFAEHLQFVRLG